jgi:hypothetical protein
MRGFFFMRGLIARQVISCKGLFNGKRLFHAKVDFTQRFISRKGLFHAKFISRKGRLRRLR